MTFSSGLHLSDTFTPEARARVHGYWNRHADIDPALPAPTPGWLSFTSSVARCGVAGPERQDEHRPRRCAWPNKPSPRPERRTSSSDARVHMSRLRQFDRAERHMDLARAMNPNDPWIQILWAWVQGCIGQPEAACPRLRSPSGSTRVIQTLQFLSLLAPLSARPVSEAARPMEERNFNSPIRHLRQLGVACFRLWLSRTDLRGKAVARLFVEWAPRLWRGDPAAGPREYVDWVVDVSYLRRDEDAERLREGLRLAGLPA